MFKTNLTRGTPRDPSQPPVRGWLYAVALIVAMIGRLATGPHPFSVPSALGIAGVCNVALRQTRSGELSMWKGCAFANAARNGVFAATLAAEGLTGPAPIFEGELGLMMAGHGLQFSANFFR